jgi:uncharacterized protein (TIGR03435 family)
MLKQGTVMTALAVCLGAGPNAIQGQSADTVPVKLPAWEVVSVKPADPSQCAQGAGLQFTPDGVQAYCTPALSVIEQAYGIMEPSRIVGVPEWAKNGTRWNIDAKMAGEDAAAFGKLDREDHSRTLQPLLAERFLLKAHIEQREMPIYELVVAKGGSKLKEPTASESGKSHMGSRRPGEIEAVNTQLTSLPWILNGEVGRPVVDKTGLTAKYDFTLEYVPAAKAATDETGGPSIFTALEEQLGLKLEPAKEQMNVLVIDSIERPAAN